jgi:hypothetical protein
MIFDEKTPTYGTGEKPSALIIVKVSTDGGRVIDELSFCCFIARFAVGALGFLRGKGGPR